MGNLNRIRQLDSSPNTRLGPVATGINADFSSVGVEKSLEIAYQTQFEVADNYIAYRQTFANYAFPNSLLKLGWSPHAIFSKLASGNWPWILTVSNAKQRIFQTSPWLCSTLVVFNA